MSRRDDVDVRGRGDGDTDEHPITAPDAAAPAAGGVPGAGADEVGWFQTFDRPSPPPQRPPAPEADETAVLAPVRVPPPAPAADGVADVPTAPLGSVLPPAPPRPDTESPRPAATPFAEADDTAVIAPPAVDRAVVAPPADDRAVVAPPADHTAVIAPPAAADAGPGPGGPASYPSPASTRRPGGWVRPLLTVLGVLVVLGGLYGGAAWAMADRVPFNTSIGGVEVGGKDSASAIAAVTDSYADRADDPVDVVVGTAGATIDPVAAGLSIDAAPVVSGLTGFSLAPADLWQDLVGAGRLPLPVSVDEDALESGLSELAGQVDVAPVEGGVVIAGGTATEVTPQAGVRLSIEGASRALQDSWLQGGQSPVELPSDTVEPVVGAESVAAAMAEAQQVLAQDLTVVVGDTTVQVPPALFGDGLSYRPDDAGALVLTVDGDAMRQAILTRDEQAESPPVDATVELQDGKPVIVPGRPGIGLDPAELASAAPAALTGGHRLELSTAAVEPEVTTEDVEKLGIVEQVSTFATPYPYNPNRTENLRIAAATINGMILMPGEVFSLNEALGERTADKGYQIAHVISNGRYSDGRGGGVSQISTTTYNAAYFAGLEIITHKPHSFYISRYPAGREATINYDPPVEMKFRNNTQYGVLIQAYLADSKVNVTFWSTKQFEVESRQTPRTNIRTPETIYDTSSSCEPSDDDSNGFDITDTRIIRDLQGNEITRESFTTSYLAAPRVICGPRP